MRDVYIKIRRPVRNSVDTSILHNLLKKHWGYDSFRPFQLEVVSSIISGVDTLAILPTGTGKSLCFQLPALALEGTCIVVSPLIALMSDQVENAANRGIPSTYLNSSLGKAELKHRLRQLGQGAYRLVYVAPERLRSESFQAQLMKTRVSFLAVDEAHCISEWGHGFRPSYLTVGRFRSKLGCPCLAVTATATPPVQREIKRLLRMSRPKVYLGSFDRPNIFLSAHVVNNRLARVAHTIERSQGSGVVYGSTRAQVERLSSYLSERGISSGFYHGGLSAEERDSAQQKWLEDRTRVIVATNAFGMGIDKSDVRFVVHASMPASLESYYQEAGRAGRDGEPSSATLFAHPRDKVLHERMSESVDVSILAGLFKTILAESKKNRYRMNLSRFHPMRRTDVIESFIYLRSRGVLQGSLSGSEISGTIRKNGKSRMRRMEHQLKKSRRTHAVRLSRMVGYVRVRSCRRRYVLNYFGGAAPTHCGSCDVCVRQSESSSDTTRMVAECIGTFGAAGSHREREVVRRLLAEEQLVFDPAHPEPFRSTTIQPGLPSIKRSPNRRR